MSNAIYNQVTTAMNEYAKTLMQQKSISFKNDVDPFIQLQNHCSKLITACPRTVSKSTSFVISDENKDGFNSLVSAIERGEDINKYLSKLINKADISDGFLDHFGCKHFHLGNELDGEFIERTGEIALAFVTDSEIFFIEAKLHGSSHPLIWYETSVLETLHRERPDLIEKFKVDTMIIEPSQTISDPNEIKKLRRKNVNTAITLSDGTSYMPINFGSSLAGFGTMHTLNFINQAKNISNAIQYCISNFKKFHNIDEIDSFEILNLRATNFKKVDYFQLKINYLKNNAMKNFIQEFNLSKN